MKTHPELKLSFTTKLQAKRKLRKPSHSVEYFHIYTDEVINGRHMTGLEYLKTIEKTWSFKYERVILIDNYNPTHHTLTAKEVLTYLNRQGMLPDYWAYEGDLIRNAQVLLEAVNNQKIKKSYARYIAKNQKYPCSLLTATWYLTRLGYLDSKGIIKAPHHRLKHYKPAKRLLNLLPQDYRTVEERARQLIMHSEFFEAADMIQDLFYPVDSGRALDLF